MKKLLIIALLCVGCVKKEITPTTKTTSAGKDLDVYSIDGCEYVGMNIGSKTGLFTHAGDCPNPVHKDTCVCK